MGIDRLKRAEFHAHISGCYHPQDLVDMVRDCYLEVNWNRFGYLDRYNQIFGFRPDPIAAVEKAVTTGDLQDVARLSVYPYSPSGRFEEFNITSYFPIAAAGYHLDRGKHEPILSPVVRRHQSEGVRYVEYRHAFGAKGKEFKEWHGKYARFLRDAGTRDYTARYIIRITSRDPLEDYQSIKEMQLDNPDLIDTIVGIDFSGKEIAPKYLLPFYKRLREDNGRDPSRALDAVVHIGESFFDLSLESAMRWCHESALYGARRLAHCIVLGISPEVAVSRQVGAHTRETVEERIDQIMYDLAHAKELALFGVIVNEQVLLRELDGLKAKDPADIVVREYCAVRLVEASKRQDYVLSELTRLGTVIETCPTSNLCIGGVPRIEYHPLKKLLASSVNLVICTDDPGIFGITLEDEVMNVCQWFALTEEQLAARVGDPYRFRLAANRVM